MTFYLSLCRKGLFTYSPPFLPKYSLPPKSVGYFNGTHPHSGRLPLTGRQSLIGWLVVSLRKFSLLFSVCHWCGGLGWRKSHVWCVALWRKSLCIAKEGGVPVSLSVFYMQVSIFSSPPFLYVSPPSLFHMVFIFLSPHFGMIFFPLLSLSLSPPPLFICVIEMQFWYNLTSLCDKSL